MGVPRYLYGLSALPEALNLELAATLATRPYRVYLVSQRYDCRFGLTRIFHPFLLRRPKSFRGCVMFRSTILKV